MSRAAATAAGRTRAPQPAARPRPRRVSGPVRTKGGAATPTAAPRPRALPAPRRPRAATGGFEVLGRRLVGLAGTASTSRWMDRLVRSRAWVVVIAFALMGIVAMQVSLLQLNTGIGRAVESAATLERQNAALRVEVSRLGSGERIHQVARDRGLVMPPPGDVRYLRAGDPRADGRRAAKAMRRPDPGAQSALAAAGTEAAAPEAAEPAPAEPAAAEPAPPAPVPAEQAAPPPVAEPEPVVPAASPPTPAPEHAAAPQAAPTGAVSAP